MNGNKAIYKSLTVIVSVVGMLLSLFGIDLSPEDQALIAANIDNVIQAVLFAIAIFGRIRAKDQIVI